jgi:hypothetical protein
MIAVFRKKAVVAAELAAPGRTRIEFIREAACDMRLRLAMTFRLGPVTRSIRLTMSLLSLDAITDSAQGFENWADYTIR